MGEYRLKAKDLDELGAHKVDNPYYKKAAPMQLYLLTQVQEAAQKKWGSSEPYIVTLADFPEQFYRWLDEDITRLMSLTPERFQYLVADRLEHMGMGVQLVGNINRKDGGVDIIAYPETGSIVPFLLAVQVKHHRTPRKTSVGDVRDLSGVINSNNLPFHMGMLVTNTSFTADASWFAENNQKLLRMRSLPDLQRWFKNDFVNEAEWREIPNSVELAPGISISIPKPKIYVPENY